MSLDDQYEHGRIPLKPLPYKNKDLASCNEFIIDYGKDRTYHMYISDSEDPTILIDLTSKMLKEILPNAKINANQFQILIEGILDPTSLQDIINFIYKRFTYPENINGFDYNRDIEKVLDPTTKSVLLRNTDGTILLPITTTNNVFDSSGKSLEDRLNNITKLGFGMTYVRATTQNQTEFEFEYPFPNYTDFVEVRIGTVYVDKTRYHITNDIDSEGNYNKAKLTFINGESIEVGRRVDILFIYNSLVKSFGKNEYMSGSNIANNSIPIIKLEKYSDSYMNNDSSSVATSAALYNLFKEMTEFISNNAQNVLWAIDGASGTDAYINVTTKNDSIFNNNENVIANITTSHSKSPTALLKIYCNRAGTYPIGDFKLRLPDGSSLTKPIPANKTLRLLLDSNTYIAYILSLGLNDLTVNRFVHTCVAKETEISFTGLEYNNGDTINVYRNGVRLFEDIDYYIDLSTEKITLYVRTQEGERIIFEALSSS